MTSHISAASGKADKRTKPYRIAITGSIASGKSAVGKLLFEMGVPVVDTDHVAHDLLNAPNPHYQKVLDRFGKDLVASEGGPIDRAKLREIVFNDTKAKADLEAILHPAIEEVTQNWIASQSDKDIVAVLVPLLFEAKLESQYDEVWCVLVDYKTQVARLMARNTITAEEADKRIGAQWSQSKKAALSNRIIDNSGTLDETKAQVANCLTAARGAIAKETVPPAASARNSEYREILQNFGHLATAAALDKMGDVSTTAHKDAVAEMTMRVLTNNEDDSHDEHLLRVNVCMHVSNKRGDGRVDCDSHGCSCNCGTTCRVSCACGPECGCDCKKPPVPPKPPCPPNDDCKPSKEQELYGFLGFLAFLALIALLAGLFFFQPWKHISPPKCDKDCNITVVIKPEPCKHGCPEPTPTPKPPCKVGCGNYGPPTPPPTPPTPPPNIAKCVSGTYITPPDFILPYLHNQVRNRVAEWKVRCNGEERGAYVIGYQADGRVADIMEFGSGLRFEQQWIVNYSPSTYQIWIDRFQGQTSYFAGRTLYQYAQNGRLMQVRRLDGSQRPLTTSTYERNPDYSLCRVVTQRYSTSGVVTDASVSMYHPDKDLMYREYFMFESFGQID